MCRIGVVCVAVIVLCAAALLGAASPAYAVQESLWEPMTIAGSSGGYSQVDFVDQDVGWVGSPWGTIATTTDGGLSWAVARAADSSYIYDIAATSKDCAWAASARYVGINLEWSVFRTTDGGQNWQTVAVGTGIPREIEAFGSDVAFVVAGGAVHATVDGGTTWTAQPFSDEVYDICFVDPQHGWARAGYIEYSEATTSVWRTTDGGSNWTQLTNLPLAYGGFQDVSFADADHGYLVDAYGYVTASTSDGGVSWTNGAPINDRHATICAVDAAHVGIREQDGMRVTDDACATWVTQPQYPDPLGTYELEVVGDRGWVVGSVNLRTERSGFSDLQPPVDGRATPRASRSSVDVRLSPQDEGSGVASTWFKVGGGEWQEGLGFTLDVPPGTANGTEYRVELSSADVYGNWETGNSFVVTVDTLAPSLSWSAGGLDDWTGGAGQYVTILAWDPWGGSGVARVDLCLDHGRWERRDPSFGVSIPAPLDHSNDGVHTIAARGVDALGNLGDVEVHWVGVDTRRPRARAPYVARAYSRGVGAIVFRVDDQIPCSNMVQTTLTIKTLGGKKLAVMEAGDLEANRWYVARFYCPLKPGKYRFFVKGVDWSGNVTARQASNYLVVKARTSTTVELRQAPALQLGWKAVSR